MLAHCSSSVRLPSPPADKTSKHMASSQHQHHSSLGSHHHHQSPPHPFLQSPTHARSNSGSLPPLILSHSSHSSHAVSKDVASLSRNDSSSSLYSFVSSSSSSATASSPTTGLGSPDLSSSLSPTIMSFASGYSLHANNNHNTTTLAQPVAIYPQEHPQRKRFSPRHSATGSSYTSYSSALALNFAEQQQQQQHQYHFNQQHQHHPIKQKSCRSSRSNSIHADNNNSTSNTTNPNASTGPYSLSQQQQLRQHHQQQQQSQPQQQQPLHLPNQLELSRARRHQNRSRPTHPGHHSISPPSPCESLDASSCHCVEFHSASAGFSTDSTTLLSTQMSGRTKSSASTPCLPPRLLSPVSPLSPSTCSLDSASATSMAQCSPLLSHSLTATTKLLPAVGVSKKMCSSGNSNNNCSSSSSSSGSNSEPSSPVDVSPCSPPTSVASTLTSCSSLATSPVRTRRTSSLNSFEYFGSSVPTFFNSNPSTVLFSPSPSPPLPTHSQAPQQQHHDSRRRQEHARRSLGLVHHQGQGILQHTLPQEGHGLQTMHYRPPTSSPTRRPLSTSSIASSARASSSGIHTRSLSLQQRQQNKLGSTSSPLIASSGPSDPLSSPQAIALSSSRYIRFIWLPLLPLLLLALGGQTSSKFENPVKYND